MGGCSFAKKMPLEKTQLFRLWKSSPGSPGKLPGSIRNWDKFEGHLETSRGLLGDMWEACGRGGAAMAGSGASGSRKC